MFYNLCYTTSGKKVIKQMLFGTFSSYVATQYGIAHEDMAKEVSEKIVGKKKKTLVYLYMQIYNF